MSDETPSASASTEAASGSLATAMFAIKELREDVGALKSQLKGLWATVMVVAVVVVILAAMTLLPRLGVPILGGGFRGQGSFNRGGIQQTAPGAPGAQGGQSAPGATAPGQ
jgi:hypothetical protein